MITGTQFLINVCQDKLMINIVKGFYQNVFILMLHLRRSNYTHTHWTMNISQTPNFLPLYLYSFKFNLPRLSTPCPTVSPESNVFRGLSEHRLHSTPDTYINKPKNVSKKLHGTFPSTPTLTQTPSDNTEGEE